MHLCDLPPAGPPVHAFLPDLPAVHCERGPCIEFNEAMDRAAADWAPATAFGHLPVGLQEVHAHLTQTQSPRDDGSYNVQTWYLNHRTAWRCNIGRPVTLPGTVHLWIEALQAIWQDEWNLAMAVNFHLVFPQPYDLEQGVQAHLLIEQPEFFDWTALLITLFDNAVAEGRPLRFAVLHGLHITFDELLHHADRDQVCDFPGTTCAAWFGWDQLHPAGVLPLRSGYGLTVMIQRN